MARKPKVVGRSKKPPGRAKNAAGRAKPRTIHCDRHGETNYGILCQHLQEGSKLGYWAIKPDAEHPGQAWCEECDAVLEADRGWTDRGDALAGWKIYCGKCYSKTLKRHALRGWDVGGSPPAE